MNWEGDDVWLGEKKKLLIFLPLKDYGLGVFFIFSELLLANYSLEFFSLTDYMLLAFTKFSIDFIFYLSSPSVFFFIVIFLGLSSHFDNSIFWKTIIFEKLDPFFLRWNCYFLSSESFCSSVLHRSCDPVLHLIEENLCKCPYLFLAGF